MDDLSLGIRYIKRLIKKATTECLSSEKFAPTRGGINLLSDMLNTKLDDIKKSSKNTKKKAKNK